MNDYYDCILGLDLALHTGWAKLCYDTGCYKASGVWDFSHSRDDTGKHNGHLFAELLDELAGTHGVLTVAYERAHHRGGPASRIGVGMASVVLLYAAEHDVHVLDVPTTTLKKFATGNGRAGKDDMKRSASEFAGLTIESDDEADAICVARWAFNKINGGCE